MSPTNETPSEHKQQKDSYYLKEIRTFDEVFKEIRKDQKIMKEKREQGLPLDDDELSGEEAEDDNRLHTEGDEDYNPIPEDLTDELDEQDIHDEDRQVLNDRVLGIINIFQTVMA